VASKHAARTTPLDAATTPPPGAGNAAHASGEETPSDAVTLVLSTEATGRRREHAVNTRDDVHFKNAHAAKPDTSDVVDVAPRGDADDGPQNHRSYDRLSNEIVRLILRDKLRPNDRLPSERILAEQLNVSRTSLREAIIALEIRGVVEVKSGSGIYVRAVTPMSFLGES